MTIPNEKLFAATLVAIFEGKSAYLISSILSEEGLSEKEIEELIEFANDEVRRVFIRDKVFLTGSLDTNGFLEWRQPKELFCSDLLCPCTDKQPLIIGESAYLYVSKEVLMARDNYYTLLDIQVKLWRDARALKSHLIVTQGVINPIVLCKVGALKRNLDLAIARQDAKYWFETGLAPFRPTPIVSSIINS